MSSKKLEIWQEAKELSIKIHEMSLALPRFEQFEEAQQIRRSGKSVRSNIKINNFLKAIERGHNNPYQLNDPSFQYQESSNKDQRI